MFNKGERLKKNRRNVNKYPKGIGLGNVFRNYLRKNKKQLIFFEGFLYFLLKWCQNFLKIIY